MESIIEVYEVIDTYGMVLEFYEVTLVEYEDEDIFAEEEQEKCTQSFLWDNDCLQPICVLPAIGGDI